MLIYFISCLYKVLSWEVIVINWIDIMNIIFRKRIIQRSYPNINLHINYVQSFQEICIYFDWPRHPNGQQWPMTGHYLWRCYIHSKHTYRKTYIHKEPHQKITKSWIHFLECKKALQELIDNAKKHEKAFNSEYLNTAQDSRQAWHILGKVTGKNINIVEPLIKEKIINNLMINRY